MTCSSDDLASARNVALLEDREGDLAHDAYRAMQTVCCHVYILHQDRAHAVIIEIDQLLRCARLAAMGVADRIRP
jgi:hypothetical protein